MVLKHASRLIFAIVRERTKNYLRSPKWASVRREHLKKHPKCAACHSIRFLQVHHILPFSDRPELELEPTNLITLCMSKFECHLMLGHGDNYRCFNPNIVAHSAALAADPKNRRAILIEAKLNRKDKP